MVRIGVTGHRRLTELDRLSAGIDEALHQVTERYPNESLAVISSLAEGADRLVVKRVLERAGARLVVPLPLDQNEYLKDFRSQESRSEFLELLSRAGKVIQAAAADDRTRGYENAGKYVLDHCDVLFAIWNGERSQGRGGTAQVVAEARRRKLPIAWIHAGNRIPGTDTPTSLGTEQGKVELENFG
ncbi:MAG TPA: hypothetical protein VGJ37_02695 [Pyrinomonadaceae bacterium]|jgi:hypothetical protein